MDNNLKRNIILENYKNPKNKGLIDDSSYIFSNTNNESCIDEVNLMAKITDSKITDIKFDGESCAICTSSASIMTNLLKEKTIIEAEQIYSNFENMLEGKKYNSDILEEANVYDDIAKQPSRKKCALLPWIGMEKIIKNYKQIIEENK